MECDVKRNVTNFKYKCNGLIVNKSKKILVHLQKKYPFNIKYIYLFLWWCEDTAK